MIKLTRYNGAFLLINESFIETVEETPDTVITMQNTHRYFVKESMDEIIDCIVDYRRSILTADADKAEEAVK